MAGGLGIRIFIVCLGSLLNLGVMVVIVYLALVLFLTVWVMWLLLMIFIVPLCKQQTFGLLVVCESIM